MVLLFILGSSLFHLYYCNICCFSYHSHLPQREVVLLLCPVLVLLALAYLSPQRELVFVCITLVLGPLMVRTFLKVHTRLRLAYPLRC